MLANDLAIDGFGRVKEEVAAVTKGLSAEQLSFRPGPDANSIAWLVWHLTRVTDDHIADAFTSEQLWHQGWSAKFNLPFDGSATGYGQSAEEVAQVKATPELLNGYYDAVHAATLKFLAQLSEDDYARIVDTHWQPPVTLGVRLVSILADSLQHVGQAAYVRGLLEAS